MRGNYIILQHLGVNKQTELRCCSLSAYLGDVSGLGLSRLGQRWADRPVADHRDPSCQSQSLPKVSRQMGMELSRRRAHFNLSPHS